MWILQLIYVDKHLCLRAKAYSLHKGYDEGYDEGYDRDAQSRDEHCTNPNSSPCAKLSLGISL